MAVQRVIVCEAQVPFVEGGAEYHVRELVRRLQMRGLDAELVSLPFKWYPKPELLRHAAAWRFLDLSQSNGRPIDLVIGSKFPTYFVRHPCKVTWLVHQYRAAYDLCGTPYGDFDHTDEDVGLRQTLLRLDRQMLAESRRLFAIARNVADRLRVYNGLEAETLYPPPRLAEQLHPGPSEHYVLSVGRIETVKRIDLAVRAMAHVRPPVRLLIVGDGTKRADVEALAEAEGLADRVEFLGRVERDELIRLYAGALAVVFAPFDEDYGYVTLESFLARKPVITAHDSGGPLEFVEDGVNGVVCAPDPHAVADAINRLASAPARAAALGDAGYDRASKVTWDGVIEKLLGE